jgi:hypothetical protein
VLAGFRPMYPPLSGGCLVSNLLDCFASSPPAAFFSSSRQVLPGAGLATSRCLVAARTLASTARAVRRSRTFWLLILTLERALAPATPLRSPRVTRTLIPSGLHVRSRSGFAGCAARSVLSSISVSSSGRRGRARGRVAGGACINTPWSRACLMMRISTLSGVPVSGGGIVSPVPIVSSCESFVRQLARRRTPLLITIRRSRRRLVAGKASDLGPAKATLTVRCPSSVRRSKPGWLL